jgi:sulfate permease, SulP family
MATQSVDFQQTLSASQRLQQFLPFTDWLVHYRRENLLGDVIAGIITAIVLVPQGMAYALLAGLPPEMGLYTSIVPLIIYGLLGTGRALAVGPVAMISLLVASGIGQQNPATVQEYISMALVLALMVGVIQLVMGVLRVGFLVNFLSHPVLSGFTSAAALVIGFSQLKTLLGFSIPRSDSIFETMIYAGEHISQTNPTVVLLGAVSIGVLLYFKFGLGKLLKALGVNDGLIMPITKMAPLVVVIASILVVWGLDLNARANVPIVGDVPAGLPSPTTPAFDIEVWQQLLPIALTIALIGYMESISVAKSLASKRRQKIDANQELIALGSANLGAAFTGGYPVAGGFGRSMVNFTAGANTGLASIITAILIAVTVLLFTPLFAFLPDAVLGSIIVVAVSSLVDVKTARQTWSYDKADFASLVVTFAAVLIVGIEMGIIIGAAVSLMLYLWRTSRPHVAVLGRIGNTEEYRNVLRHKTVTYPSVLALRVDESLYFPNTQYLEEIVLGAVADNPEIEHFVLDCSAVNYIDTSALEVLERLGDELADNDIDFNMASVKGPVMDRLKQIGFVDHFGADRFFLNMHQAMQTLTTGAPLRHVSA